MSMSRQHLGISSNGCTQTMAFTSVYLGATSSGHTCFGVQYVELGAARSVSSVSYVKLWKIYKISISRSISYRLGIEPWSITSSDWEHTPGRRTRPQIKAWWMSYNPRDKPTQMHGQCVWRTLKLRESQGGPSMYCWAALHADLAHRDVPASMNVIVSG